MVRCKKIIPEHYIKPQCEAKLLIEAVAYKSEHWSKNHRGAKPDECRSVSSIKLEDKNLCKKHAALRALEILLEESE